MNTEKSNKKPIISVVCATYNRSRMVRETVLAAWNQTLRPDEIVVSDDCSTDDTLEVLRELQKEVPVLKIVESLKNSGGVQNWNQVIDASSGDIIAWCSDDDRFLPDHLERVVCYLNKHADVGLVHTGFVNVEEMPDGSENRMDSSLRDGKEIVVDMNSLITYMTHFYNWPFHPSTWTFRRSVWKDVGYFNAYYALADTDWFIRAALKNKLVYLPYLGVLNRRHTGNWSNRVGVVGMQREFYLAMQQFVNAVNQLKQNKFNPLDQFNKWLWTYRRYLFRIYISRSRAGKVETALDSAKALTECTPLINFIPRQFRYSIALMFYYVFFLLQKYIFRDKNKYNNIGTVSP